MKKYAPKKTGRYVPIEVADVLCQMADVKNRDTMIKLANELEPLYQNGGMLYGYLENIVDVMEG